MITVFIDRVKQWSSSSDELQLIYSSTAELIYSSTAVNAIPVSCSSNLKDTFQLSSFFTLEEKPSPRILQIIIFANKLQNACTKVTALTFGTLNHDI